MALTAASVQRESVGSLTLFIVNFASVSSAGDTYSSGLPNIVSAWCSATTATAGAGQCSFVSSTGVVTVAPTIVASEVNLYILSKV